MLASWFQGEEGGSRSIMSAMISCPFCRSRVLLSAEGICSSCRRPIDQEHPPTPKLPATASTDQGNDSARSPQADSHSPAELAATVTPASPATGTSPATAAAQATSESETDAARQATLACQRLVVDTLVPRSIAAIIDLHLALFAMLLSVELLKERWAYLLLPLLLLEFLLYYGLCEALLGRTPGKLLTGLMVVQLDGSRCTTRQAIVRTLWRLVEINPLFCGAIPAAFFIVRSPTYQRLGDRFAGTLVVRSARVARRRA